MTRLTMVGAVSLTDRLLTADDVRRRWFCDPSGKPMVSVSWVLRHIPRVQLSAKVVRFRADDVELFLASKVRAA